MQNNSSKRREFIIPTPDEDAAINAGIAADPDTCELSDAEFRGLRRGGRPKSTSPLKVATTIRFDADLLAALKESGPGWQTRVNDAVREWLRAHSAL